MRQLAGICFLLLSFAFKAGAAITAFVNHKVFYVQKGEAFSPYLEVYWEIDPVSLHFEQIETGWQTRLRVDVRLSNDTGAFSEDHFIFQTAGMPDKQSAMSQALIDLHRYSLRPGKIKLDISLTELDNAAGNSFSYTDTFTVGPLKDRGISELQLIDTAFKSRDESPFFRNSMQHFPLNVAFLDERKGALNYYFEVYGLDKLKDQEPFIQSVYISRKPDDAPIDKMIKMDTLVPGSVVPVYGSMNIMSLHSGNYYLNASVYNKSGKEIDRKAIFFQRFNKKPWEDTTIKRNEFDTSAQKDIVVLDIHRTFVGKYTHEQLVAILKMLLPISRGAEKQNIFGFLSKPNEVYTRHFVYNFWAARNAAKPEKEWEKYADKVREVNRIFGSAGKPGYETERGMAYLKYGKPNERLVVSAEQDALPYEVWQYFSVAGQGKDGVFLFYKPPQLANDYILLHSTVTGEARDMNWRNYLYPNGRKDNTDSKAEQYLRNR